MVTAARSEEHAEAVQAFIADNIILLREQLNIRHFVPSYRPHSAYGFCAL